jgi:hypothetical protein
MSARTFCGDDAGYLAWLDTHPAGYLINIHRSYGTRGNPGDSRLHHASCRSLPRSQRGSLTDPYVKVCADDLADLEAWARATLRGDIQPCGSCHGRSRPVRVTDTAAAAPTGRYLVLPPKPGSAMVTAWADDYIRFQDEPDWQKTMRQQIISGCANLHPSDTEVLHATFYGDKRAGMDIENLVLYNMLYSFAKPGHNGIRFEHGSAPPDAAEEYRFAYRYALAPRSDGFRDWTQCRTVASFDWTDLGLFRRSKILAQVWLALARRRDAKPEQALPAGSPFAITVKIRPPQQISPGLNSNLVKGVIDGVVCAFQAHTDTSTSAEVAARLANALPANAEEIEALLLDRRWAVLGAVPQLVRPWRESVQWYPSDDSCYAGELIAESPEATGTSWTISGRIVELSR